MKNFIFKSNASDLQKMFQSIETIQKNVLYLTYRIDSLLKEVKTLTTDKGLQKQVDEYFEEPTLNEGFDSLTTIKNGKITSHQTDSEEQNGPR